MVEMTHRNRWFIVLKHGGIFHGELLGIKNRWYDLITSWPHWNERWDCGESSPILWPYFRLVILLDTILLGLSDTWYNYNNYCYNYYLWIQYYLALLIDIIISNYVFPHGFSMIFTARKLHPQDIASRLGAAVWGPGVSGVRNKLGHGWKMFQKLDEEWAMGDSSHISLVNLGNFGWSNPRMFGCTQRH